ncbi:twitching motility protein PilT [Haloechinothrix sp. LS1_15]|nr:twitching motility protein PilT [Haloechinothrix sp. LS1_15]
MPIAPLLDRIWELRDTITVDGAAYVALAERIDGALLTCDGTLGAATGPRCAIDVIT